MMHIRYMMHKECVSQGFCQDDLYIHNIPMQGHIHAMMQLQHMMHA